MTGSNPPSLNRDCTPDSSKFDFVVNLSARADKTLLGKGGFGSVFRLKEKGRDYAVKVAGPFDLSGNQPKKLLRFLTFYNEWICLRSLRHPQIIKVLDIKTDPVVPVDALNMLVGFLANHNLGEGSTRGLKRALEVLGRRINEYVKKPVTCYLVMEYYPSIDLHDWIIERSGHQTADFDSFISIVIQVILVFSDLHRMNVVFNDIKPANILIGADSGLLKVCDFGGAGQVNFQVAQLAFTTSYLAPERVARRLMGTAQSDTYALGRTILRLGETVNWKRFPQHYPRVYSMINHLMSEEPQDRPSLQSIFHTYGDLFSGVNFEKLKILTEGEEKAVCKRYGLPMHKSTGVTLRVLLESAQKANWFVVPPRDCATQCLDRVCDNMDWCIGCD